MGRGNKRVSLSIVVSTKICLKFTRDEAAVVEEEVVVVGVEVEEGEVVDAGVVAGKTIESALRRLTNATRSSNDTTTVFWAWKTMKDTTSGLH
jgi:hypothetical protein